MNQNQVTEREMLDQRQFAARVREKINDRAARLGRPLRAHIDTFGCQQNENDSEKLMGELTEMGFIPWDTRDGADFLILNTCAVREHAEQRVYGNLGALKKIKEKNPSVLIGLCGCMAQQPHIAQTIAEKYKHVDILFGPQALYRFPSLVWQRLDSGKNVVDILDEPGRIAEGIPQVRAQNFSAYVTIMSGCNNFCSYCIVPYVRGRERSRETEPILTEIRQLIAAGCREITLLGQNVNSYGKDLENGDDFAGLLRKINALEGDFRIKFMTSHPKDISKELLDTMASCEKICKHLHLPVQSGSNRVLEAMNRRYTREKYLETIAYARSVMPEITLTSDLIVGFPGETEEDFEETLSLVKEVRYEMLFSFLYSRRKGTPAYDRKDQIPYDVKLERFNRLLALQAEISAEQNEKLRGRVFRVLVTGTDEKQRDYLASRTESNKLVFFRGDPSLTGQIVPVRITEPKTWFLYAEREEEK